MITDPSGKMSFDEIVRYLFTGLTIFLGYLLAERTSIYSWFNTNEWAVKLLPGSLGVVAVFYAGYIVFHVYRGLIEILSRVVYEKSLGASRWSIV